MTLWQELSVLLDGLDEQVLTIQHTPGHLDPNLTETPAEDWLADLQAGLANVARPQDFWTLHEKALGYYHKTLAITRALRGVYFGIADLRPEHNARHEEDAHEDGHGQSLSPADVALDHIQ